MSPKRHPTGDGEWACPSLVARAHDLSDLLIGQNRCRGGKRSMSVIETNSPPRFTEPSERHAHLLQFYEDDEVLADEVAEFLETCGIGASGAAIVIATGAHGDGIERSLVARGLDASALKSSGRLTILDARQTLDALLVDGVLDRGRFETIIGTRVARLAARGPLSLFGEMVALLWAEGRNDAALELEALWNDLGREHRFSLLCAYPMRDMAQSADADLRHVCAAHDHALPVRGNHAAASWSDRLLERCELQRRAWALEREVQQRREAEALLQSRDRELTDFLENAPIAIHKVGPDGTVLWANRAELAMLGYPASEYIGRHIGDFYVDRGAAAGVLERLSRGECLADEPAQMRHRDGSVRDVLVSSNVCWSEGRFLHTRCFTTDVTARVRAERSLRQLKERTQQVQELLSAIVESSQDAILSKSLAGKITSWNRGAEDLLGYAASEAIGASVQLIIPPEMYEEENALLQRLAQGEAIAQFETVRVAKDGRRVDVSLMLSPIRDGQGQVIGVSSVARDISYRKQMEQRLRKEDRLKNEFIAMLGHELRNPLAPIRSGVEFLRRTLAGGSGSGQVCEMIERQVAHMSRLLDDLLDVTRITRGEIRLQPETIDVRTIVQRAVEASRPLLESHRHELQVRLPQDELAVHGDAVRLVQMMTNLLNNAAHYTPEGGRIEVSVEGLSDHITIRVKDNGVGLAPDLQDCIFDLFVRGPMPEHGSREGLGIGLSLVRMIAEHHHGTVEAHSAGPGTGSEFVVRLRRSASAACPDVDAVANPATGTVKRIVLVDDNADAAQALAMLLRLSGHDVSIAGDARSGIDCIAAVKPHVAFVDIGLPDMTGYQVAQHLRCAGNGATLIAMTGYGTVEDRAKSAAAGFDHHLVKPVGIAEIERLIANP